MHITTEMLQLVNPNKRNIKCSTRHNYEDYYSETNGLHNTVHLWQIIKCTQIPHHHHGPLESIWPLKLVECESK